MYENWCPAAVPEKSGVYGLQVPGLGDLALGCIVPYCGSPMPAAKYNSTGSLGHLRFRQTCSRILNMLKIRGRQATQVL